MHGEENGENARTKSTADAEIIAEIIAATPTPNHPANTAALVARGCPLCRLQSYPGRISIHRGVEEIWRFKDGGYGAMTRPNGDDGDDGDDCPASLRSLLGAGSATETMLGHVLGHVHHLSSAASPRRAHAGRHRGCHLTHNHLGHVLLSLPARRLHPAARIENTARHVGLSCRLACLVVVLPFLHAHTMPPTLRTRAKTLLARLGDSSTPLLPFVPKPSERQQYKTNPSQSHPPPRPPPQRIVVPVRLAPARVVLSAQGVSYHAHPRPRCLPRRLAEKPRAARGVGTPARECLAARAARRLRL